MSADSTAGTRRTTPERILLLYSDPADAVARVLLQQPSRFGRDVIALSLQQLVEEVEAGPQWTWAGRTIDPGRTAVVNRLTSIEPQRGVSLLASAFQRRQFSGWLHDELRRFAYASALPTAISPVGDYGSLRDQWADIPHLVGGVRVPDHGTSHAPSPEAYAVDADSLYSLGKPVAAVPAAELSRKLIYVRPRGQLFHVAQVGGLFLAVNAPPHINHAQQEYVSAFVKAMAALSENRILEHAFFAGDALPVFYSTCAVPVITGRLPAYANLVVEGLRHDIEYGRRLAAA
jgi:hypothetical protein